MSEPIWRSITEVVTVVDMARYVRVLDERFGIPTDTFDDFVAFYPNKRVLWIVDRALEVPCDRSPYAAGIPFFHVTLRFPRPTTAAALRFGSLARRHVLELETEQLDAFLEGEPIDASCFGSDAIDSPGYVIAKYAGHLVGLGVARSDTERPDRFTISGMCPKNWRQRMA